MTEEESGNRREIMKVKDAMTSDVHLTNPNETVQQAASLMASLDAGVLPVGENDRLVGMITDRDIAVKGVARGMGPDTKIREIMTPDVKYCFADQDLKDVTQNMSDLQVRRLPVLDHDKRLVGIISLGDIAVMKNSKANGTGRALSGISRPGGQHSQTG
jgi:CBS domain-containing protein